MKGVTLSKWGNGQGIRIPQSISQMLNIGIGDQLRMEVKNNQITLTPCKPSKLTLESLFANYDGPSYQTLFGDEMNEWDSMEPVGLEVINE